jgi:hypothetical protein
LSEWINNLRKRDGKTAVAISALIVSVVSLAVSLYFSHKNLQLNARIDFDRQVDAANQVLFSPQGSSATVRNYGTLPIDELQVIALVRGEVANRRGYFPIRVTVGTLDRCSSVKVNRALVVESDHVTKLASISFVEIAFVDGTGRIWRRRPSQVPAVATTSFGKALTALHVRPLTTSIPRCP